MERNNLGRDTGQRESVARDLGAPGDVRPSDRAGPARVGLLSVHTSPLEQAGTGDSGGMNVYLVALARRLVEAGVGVDVYTRANGADLPATVDTSEGYRVHHLQAGPFHAPKEDLATHLCAFYLRLAAHHTLSNLDLVHGHYWMSGWVGRKLRVRRGMPFVQSFHTLGRVKNDRLAPGDTPEPALRLTAEERVVVAADAVVAPTESEAALLRQRYGAQPGQLHVVEPGVDLGIFTPAGDRHAARQALGGGRIVLFVGRLQPLKAPHLAVEALAALDAHLPDDGLPTRLVVIGGPSGNGHGAAEPSHLRRLAADLGVADRVAFLAPRPQRELAGLYRAADVVLVPSHSESFGLVALEAQACGTPVVAADVGGLRQVVGHDGGGTLVDGREPAAFAAALAPYLTDARLRAAASEAALGKAARYSWQRTTEATLDVYRSVLDARERRLTASGAEGA